MSAPDADILALADRLERLANKITFEDSPGSSYLHASTYFASRIGLIGEAAAALRDLVAERQAVLDVLMDIWQRTNLPFTDADRHEIQRLALSTVRSLGVTEEEG